MENIATRNKIRTSYCKCIYVCILYMVKKKSFNPQLTCHLVVGTSVWQPSVLEFEQYFQHQSLKKPQKQFSINMQNLHNIFVSFKASNFIICFWRPPKAMWSKAWQAQWKTTTRQIFSIFSLRFSILLLLVLERSNVKNTNVIWKPVYTFSSMPYNWASALPVLYPSKNFLCHSAG